MIKDYKLLTELQHIHMEKVLLKILKILIKYIYMQKILMKKNTDF